MSRTEQPGTRLPSFPRRRSMAGMLALAALSFGGGWSAQAAGNLSVSPTRVDLSDAGTGTVAIRNNGGEASVLQVSVMRWLDSPMPDALVPAPELIAVPPVFVLKGGKQQIVRLALRERQRPLTERSFRLLISEVPAPAGGDDSGGGVRFSLGFNVPVFQKPAGALAEPVWSVTSGARGPVLALRNAGQAHVQVSSIRVTGAAGGALADLKDAFYLLPGRSRSWELPAKASSQTLMVVADTNLGTLEERLAAPRD